MKIFLPFLGTAFSATIPLGFAPPQPIQPVQPVQVVQQAPLFQGMDPMMLTLLMDDDSDFKDILPLMMMNGGNFGNGQFNPLLLTLLSDDDSDSSDLLPFLLMQQTPGQQMNPLLMLTLLDNDECEVSDNVAKFTSLTDAEQKKVARGEYYYKETTGHSTATLASNFLVDADLVSSPLSSADLAEVNKYIDYEFISCEHLSDKGNFKDLLPLMMMGQANMQTMDPMMLMMLVDDDSNDLSLPMLMSMQGQNTGLAPNPLLWLTLLDDSKLTKKQCDAKYAIDYLLEVTGTTSFSFTKQTTGIRTIVESINTANYGSQHITDYKKCITDATKEGSDSSFKDILPLMMLNGGTGQIDPLMLTLLADDDSDSDNLLPLLLMNQQPGQQLDPMMLALLLKD